MQIHLLELEAAINFWRAQKPSSPDAFQLAPEVAALAEPYALMILSQCTELEEGRLSVAARSALQVWRATQGNQNG